MFLRRAVAPADYRRGWGGWREVPEAYGLRLSFCSARDGCRKRATPPSVRFLGRKVFLGAVVVLVAAMRHRASPRHVRRAYRVLRRRPADHRSLAGLSTPAVSPTAFWKEGRGRFAVELLSLSCPAHCWRPWFAGTIPAGSGRDTGFSLADHDRGGPARSREFAENSEPAEDTREFRAAQDSRWSHCRFHLRVLDFPRRH